MNMVSQNGVAASSSRHPTAIDARNRKICKSRKAKSGLKNTVIRFHNTDPDATDSGTDSDVDSVCRPQQKTVATTIVVSHSIIRKNQTQNPEPQELPQRRQTLSKHVGVRKKSGKWVAEIWICGGHRWLGAFHSEVEAHEVYQAAALRYREEKEQQGQSCQNVAGPDNRAMTRNCKFCQEANQICKYCDKVAATIAEAKKGKAKVGTVRGEEMTETLISPSVCSQSVVPEKKVRTKKTKRDMNFQADKSSDIPAAPVEVGDASSVHDDSSTKPRGFLEDLSAQLRKVLEATPEDGLEDDLIELNELPDWTKNLDCCDFSFSHF